MKGSKSARLSPVKSRMWRGPLSALRASVARAVPNFSAGGKPLSFLRKLFEVRPLFTGPIPEGMERCGPLQDEVMAAADDLRQLLPGEKGSK